MSMVDVGEEELERWRRGEVMAPARQVRARGDNGARELAR